MTALSKEITRITNELADLGWSWLNDITIEEFLKRIIEENKHETGSE